MQTILAIITALSTPCPTEDSANCHWNAQTMGNGHGTSFLAIERADGSDLVIYTNGRVAVFN